MPQKQLRVPRATRSPETARPRQVPPTQQSSRFPAKERASQPNSASDDFSKLPSRRRQVITTFPFFGSAVERSIVDLVLAERQFKYPCLCFSFSYFSAALLYVRVLLLYTHGRFVGCWWMSFYAVYCVLHCCTRYNAVSYTHLTLPTKA